jgi:putative DNA primase/helicase
MKPTALPVRLEGIPSELKGMNAWVMWSYRERGGNWTKVPRMIDGKNASSTDATTWASYADVVDTLIMDNGFDGIGLMLGADVQGIDLDDCRDLATGALSEFAEEVLARVDGYAETSPSGTGIKIFTRSNLDGGRTKKELGLELYKDGRYFTVTGHGINGHDLSLIHI